MTYPAGPGDAGVPPQYRSPGQWVPDPAYQGGGWYSHPGLGTRYSERQLETLWIRAGGSRQLAPVMAAIAAQKESGGYSAAWNSTGATGLWQIEWPGSAPHGWTRERLFDPEMNARAAVLLSGNSMSGVASNWSGDLGSISVPGFDPASHLPPGSGGKIAGGKGGSGGSGGGTSNATLTAAEVAAAQSTCAIQLSVLGGVGSGFLGKIVLGIGGEAALAGWSPKYCLLSKTQLRAMIGVGLLGAGLSLMLFGMILIVSEKSDQILGAKDKLTSAAGTFALRG